MNRKWAEESSSEDDSVGDNNTPEEPSNGDGNGDDHEQKTDNNLVGNETFNAFMSGISYEAKEKDVLAFLADQRCSVHSVSFLKREGLFKGSAVIKLNDNSSFEICLALNRRKFPIGQLKVKIDEMPQAHSVRHQKRIDEHGFSKEINSAFVESDRHRGKKDNTIRMQQARWVPEVDVRESENSSQPVKERPKLNLKPRTLPIENSKLQVPKADIFGGGKPHDELEYEMKKAGKDTLEKPEVVFKMPQTMNVDEGKDTAPALSVRGGNYKEGNSRIIPKNCEIIGERSLIEKRGVRSDNEKLPVEGDSVVQMKFSKRNNKRFPKENEKSKDSGRTVVLVDQADSSKQKSSSFKSKKGPVLGAEHRIFKEAVKRSGTSNEKKITGRHKQIDVDDLKSVEARHEKFEKAQQAMKVETKQKVGTTGAYAMLDLDSDED